VDTQGSGTSGLRGIVLTVRFLCELGMLVALAYWGFTVVDGALAWALGLGAPTLVAAIWARFVSPKAKRTLSMPLRVSVEIDLFVLSASRVVRRRPGCRDRPRRAPDRDLGAERSDGAKRIAVKDKQVDDVDRVLRRRP
jgi:hypothetical protein